MMRQHFKKPKRLAERLFYIAVDRVLLWRQACPHHSQPRTGVAVIVFTQLMGDYFMWRPYAAALFASLNARSIEVVIICNAVWLELARAHFPKATCIGIDRTRFARELGYRLRMIKDIRAIGATTAFNANYPRDSIISHAIVRATGAAATGHLTTYDDQVWLDHLDLRDYRQVVQSPQGHQAGAHRALLAASGVQTIERSILKPAQTDTRQQFRYIVLSPFASHSLKIWEARRFATVANQLLLAIPGLRIVVIGASKEHSMAASIIEEIEGETINLTGALSLSELVAWIAHAAHVIGNDSAAVHIAAACGVTSTAIVAGGDYGRSLPYDENMAALATPPNVVSHAMPCFGCQWNCIYPQREGEAPPCLDAITPQAVLAAIALPALHESTPPDATDAPDSRRRH